MAPRGYSGAQKALHWASAALILGLIPAGLVMVALEGGEVKNRLYEAHKSVGLVVLALAAARLLVRLSRGAPELEPGLPAWQRRAAHASHILLYALIVIVPLLGWAGTSACCAPVSLFGALPVTLPIGGGMETGKVILAVHRPAALLLAGVVAIHVGAALQHHFLRRDRTLRRMLPGGSGQRETIQVADEAGRS